MIIIAGYGEMREWAKLPSRMIWVLAKKKRDLCTKDYTYAWEFRSQGGIGQFILVIALDVHERKPLENTGSVSQ